MSMTETAGPVAAAQRIDSLDIIRGFALFGILILNIVGMGMPLALYMNPTAAGAPSPAELQTWFITNTFFEGSMRTLFSMLFGAGFVLFLERADAKGLGVKGAALYGRRTLLLILLGIFNVLVLLWHGDILFTYGFAALFLLAFYGLGTRTLIAWFIALALISAMFNLGGGQKFLALDESYAEAIAARDAGETLSGEQTELIEGWEQGIEFWNPSPEMLQAEYDAAAGGWASMAASNAEFLFGKSIGFFFALNILDAVMAMIAGMVAYRWGLLQGRWSAGAAAALMVGGFAVGGPVNWLESQRIIDSGFSIHGFFQAMVTYDLGRFALAFGWLGAVLLLCKAGPLLGWLRVALAAVGKLALTNYLAHSLIAAVFFIGMGNFGKLTRVELYYVVVAMWAFNIIFSLIWLRFFQFGPVEWLWRAGTYGHWPPLFKKKPGAATHS